MSQIKLLKQHLIIYYAQFSTKLTAVVQLLRVVSRVEIAMQ